MAKKETKRASSGAESLRKEAPIKTQELIDDFRARSAEERNRADTSFSGALKGYQEAQQTGGYDPGILEGLRSRTGEVSKTGGYDPDRVAGLRDKFSKVSETGGYDSGELDFLRGKGKEFTGTSGAYDPEVLAKITGGYTDFSETGGYSPESRAAFMRNATSGVGDIYKVLQGEAERKRSLTGGLGGGGDISQMARQLSQQQAKAATGAQVDLDTMIARNRLAGLGGLSASGSDVAGQRQAALGGLGALESDVAQGKRVGTSAEAGFEGDVARGVREGTGQQLGLEEGVARGSLTGTAGMGSLYNAASGNITDLGNQMLASLGLNFKTQQEAVDALQRLSQNPGLFDNIMKSIQVGSGAIAGAMGAPSGG